MRDVRRRYLLRRMEFSRHNWSFFPLLIRREIEIIVELICLMYNVYEDESPRWLCVVFLFRTFKNDESWYVLMVWDHIRSWIYCTRSYTYTYTVLPWSMYMTGRVDVELTTWCPFGNMGMGVTWGDILSKYQFRVRMDVFSTTNEDYFDKTKFTFFVLDDGKNWFMNRKNPSKWKNLLRN